jgi:hypothetical protein
MVAGDEDREGQQHQRGNQTAAPPTILPEYLLLDMAETPFKARFRAIHFTSSDTWFFRHERYLAFPLFPHFRRLSTDHPAARPFCGKTNMPVLRSMHPTIKDARRRRKLHVNQSFLARERAGSCYVRSGESVTANLPR